MELSVSLNPAKSADWPGFSWNVWLDAEHAGTGHADHDQKNSHVDDLPAVSAMVAVDQSEKCRQRVFASGAGMNIAAEVNQGGGHGGGDNGGTRHGPGIVKSAGPNGGDGDDCHEGRDDDFRGRAAGLLHCRR